MIQIPTIVSLSLISIFLTGYYTPLNPIRNWIVDKYISKCISWGLYRGAELALFLTCAKCMSFMVSLIYTCNLPQAILCSMITVVIKYIIEYVTKPKLDEGRS